MQVAFETRTILDGGEAIIAETIKEVTPPLGLFTASYYSVQVWTLDVSKYSFTRGILGQSLSYLGIKDNFNCFSYLEDAEYFQWSVNSNDSQSAFPLVVYLYFSFNHKVIKTEIAPDSIFTGLAQIGGLLGLLKVFTLVSKYQERRFESELT
jgi:hypothetical protein